MSKQRIAIDMDEVMAFTVNKIVKRYEETFNYTLTEKELNGKLVEDAVPTELDRPARGVATPSKGA